LVHGTSRPIGAFLNVPHGLSNAMLLPIVTRYSIAAAPERYAACARAMGVASATDSTAAAQGKLLTALHDINERLAVPTLEAFGASKERFLALLPTMAEQPSASGAHAHQPRTHTTARSTLPRRQLATHRRRTPQISTIIAPSRNNNACLFSYLQQPTVVIRTNGRRSLAQPRRRVSAVSKQVHQRNAAITPCFSKVHTT